MWLLILALVMLSISALLSAYITLCYRHKQRYQRPMIFNRHEGLFGLTNIALFVPGIVMVFIVAGWKWGLVGLVIYWVLVVFVLMPIVSKRFFSFEFERIRSDVLEAKMKKVKVLTDNASERKTVAWDGEGFRVIQDNKLQKETTVITLNPKEMLELVQFAATLANEDIVKPISEKGKK